MQLNTNSIKLSQILKLKNIKSLKNKSFFCIIKILFMESRKIWCDKKKNFYYVNESYFDNWNNDMAYVLGYFSADGCLTKNSKRQNYFIEFVSTDFDLIVKVKESLDAKQKISERKIVKTQKKAYRIQIGSKKIFSSLVKLGFCPRKSNVMKFPKVPIIFLPDFIRGYFDGDGFVSYGEYPRKGRKKIGKFLLSGFVSGSERYIFKLKQLLAKYAGIQGGSAYYGQGYRLTYSINDSCPVS